MRKAFGQTLRIGVSARGMALLKARRWGGPGVELVAEHHFGSTEIVGHDALAAGMRRLLADAGCAGWSATIVLADDLARLWQVIPPQNSTRLADLEAAAALRFQALYGEPAANWQLAAGWDAAQPFLAAAMPRHLLALLQQVAAEQQVTLVEIVPQFVAGWNQWRHAVKADAWYGLVQHGVFTLGVVEQGALRMVRAVALPDGTNATWLGQHVAREALRLNVTAPARLQISGAAPTSWNSGTQAALVCNLLVSGHGALPPAAQLAATGARA